MYKLYLTDICSIIWVYIVGGFLYSSIDRKKTPFFVWYNLFSCISGVYITISILLSITFTSVWFGKYYIKIEMKIVDPQ